MASPNDSLDLRNSLRAREKELGQLRGELEERNALLQKAKVVWLLSLF